MYDDTLYDRWLTFEALDGHVLDIFDYEFPEQPLVIGFEYEIVVSMFGSMGFCVVAGRVSPGRTEWRYGNSPICGTPWRLP